MAFQWQSILWLSCSCICYIYYCSGFGAFYYSTCWCSNCLMRYCLFVQGKKIATFNSSLATNATVRDMALTQSYMSIIFTSFGWCRWSLKFQSKTYSALEMLAWRQVKPRLTFSCLIAQGKTFAIIVTFIQKFWFRCSLTIQGKKIATLNVGFASNATMFKTATFLCCVTA